MAQTVVMSKELSLKYSGKTISYCTSFDLDISKEQVEISHLESAGWKENQSSGMKEWSISFNGLITKGSVNSTGYTDYDAMLDSLFLNDELVTVVISGPYGMNNTLTGSAILTNLKSSISVGGIVTYSGSLSGSGALVIA